ncbi:WBC30 protein, partial [Uria aalge]|nr:WBC30 protein [Uria aalge]
PTDGVTGDVCPAGAYCPPGSPLPIPCPPGTYSNMSGLRSIQEAGSCKPCPAGMYCSVAGLTEPEGHCQPGYYCIQGRTKTAKPEDGISGDLCPRGHFCPAGSAAPSPCPTGEY